MVGHEGRCSRLRALAASILLVGGLVAMLVGGGALLATWYASRTWAATDEAEHAARQLAAETPRWLDEPSAPRSEPDLRLEAAARRSTLATADTRLPPVAQVPRPVPADGAERSARSAITPTVDPAVAGATPASPSSPASETVTIEDAPAAASVADQEPTPEARAPAEAVSLVASDFRFLDPPEPGAQARISVEVRNRADLPTGPLHLLVPTRWFDPWKVVAADPPVLDDREGPDKRREFIFPGLGGQADDVFEIQLVAKDDAVDPPDLRLALDDGGEIGRARPETVAPRPRPGPARTIAIPRLGLRTAVVQTAWEPPGWVVGQLRDTANLSEGNTVLIGHLTGLAGNVFANLDRLLLGDEIIATSRGLDYHFVVSQTMVLPFDNSLPMEPSDSPRLTLMTCSGDWNPITHDYSHRLWVVAEPLELAQSTLAGGPGPLTRDFGLVPTPENVPLDAPDPPPTAPDPPPPAPDPPTQALISPNLPPADEAPADAPPAVLIRDPADGARVGRRVTIRGIRTADADPTAPLWLVVRADVEGSHWYLYQMPLDVRPDGTWQASLELGGEAGVHQTIVVAPVDPATDRLLRRYVVEHPGQPLRSLPPAFRGGAQIVVVRQ